MVVMTDEQHRDEALAWLAGRLRWERLLTELHQRTEVTATATAAPTEAPAPPRAA